MPKYAYENNEDIEEATRSLGPDAKPTGRIRMVRNHPSRKGLVFDFCIEQEWVGCFGKGWTVIPSVEYIADEPAVPKAQSHRQNFVRSFLVAMGYKAS